MADVGRPRAFETPQEFEDAINDYLNTLPETDTPTFAGFAAHCNVGERTVYDYSKKDGFSQSWQAMKSHMKRWWLNNAAHNEINPTIAKLVLSANFDMSEKSIQQMEGPEGEPLVFKVIDATADNNT